MPILSNHQSSEFTKLLLMGDSKSGKTGSLAPLTRKYKLRILDYDNGLDALAQVVKRTPLPNSTVTRSSCSRTSSRGRSNSRMTLLMA